MDADLVRPYSVQTSILIEYQAGWVHHPVVGIRQGNRLVHQRAVGFEKSVPDSGVRFSALAPKDMQSPIKSHLKLGFSSVVLPDWQGLLKEHLSVGAHMGELQASFRAWPDHKHAPIGGRLHGNGAIHGCPADGHSSAPLVRSTGSHW